jgi:hexosaminidase
MARSLFLLAVLAAAQQAAVAAAPALMPLPVKVEPAAGKLTIDGSFSVAASGFSDARLNAALDRFAALIGRQTGILMLTPHAPDAAAATLRVECLAAGPDYPTLGEDESYTLDVTPQNARLQAVNISGALRGLATFAQLVTPGPDGFQAAATHIEDRPRFPWRGLMLDVSRHWMPMEVVKRNLDAMAAVKLNVFHWHLSDDQGFRVESKRYPKLQGAGSDGRFYTQDDIRAIVAYARDRGIRVIPEFDIPAHTQSWFPGYPDLSAEPGVYQIGRTWGIYEPVMDPTVESTYDFLDNFIGEMVALFPDPYFHIGGDEVNPVVWTRSTRIQAFIKEHNLTDVHGLQAYFNQRVLKILEKYNRTMVGWDEILHPDLPQAAVIHSWRGQKGLADAVNAGHRGILSWGYYLDHLNTAAFHYKNDPIGSGFTPQQAAMVLGGEACMWVEYANAETVDSRIWPRLAVIAERLWSAKEVTDVASMYERMTAVSRQLEWTGIQHRANYLPMLDRMAAGRPTEPLRVVADAVEAQGLGPRARARKYTSLIPLNRLVDAARPESETALAMEIAAKRLNPGDIAYLREQFTRWAANDERFQRLATGNVLLTEILPVSKDLSAVGDAGLKALDYLRDGTAPPATWVTAQNQEIARMLKPNVEVILAAARPLKILIDRASRGPR